MTAYVGIDISTKTGFVRLNALGDVLEAKEISVEGTGTERMIKLIDLITSEITNKDNICIEGFSYNSKGRSVDIQYGLGHGVRMELFRAGIPYYIVPPSQLKQFTGAKGNGSKISVAINVHKRWGFEPVGNNDNITDAYVLAQMARAIKGVTPVCVFQQKIIDKINITH